MEMSWACERSEGKMTRAERTRTSVCRREEVSVSEKHTPALGEIRMDGAGVVDTGQSLQALGLGDVYTLFLGESPR